MISTIARYHQGRAKAHKTPRRGVKNKTEEAYANHLNMLLRAGEIRKYGFETHKLRLADGAYYCPDFAVFETDDTITFQEVKGFWREAARLRIKVAASLYPEYRFVAIKREKGQWIEEQF